MVDANKFPRLALALASGLVICEDSSYIEPENDDESLLGHVGDEITVEALLQEYPSFLF